MYLTHRVEVVQSDYTFWLISYHHHKFSNDSVKNCFFLMTHKKKNGVGAVCSILIRFLHPACDIMAARYPNARYTDRLDGLVSQSREVKNINHKDQTVVVFRHDDFPTMNNLQELKFVEQNAIFLMEEQRRHGKGILLKR